MSVTYDDLKRLAGKDEDEKKTVTYEDLKRYAGITDVYKPTARDIAITKARGSVPAPETAKYPSAYAGAGSALRDFLSLAGWGAADAAASAIRGAAATSAENMLINLQSGGNTGWIDPGVPKLNAAYVPQWTPELDAAARIELDPKGTSGRSGLDLLAENQLDLALPESGATTVPRKKIEEINAKGAESGEGGLAGIIRGTASGVGQVGAAIGANILTGGTGGLALIGLSAKANAIEKARNEGADAVSAMAYGNLVGAGEILVETLSGGIPSMGEGAIGRVMGRVISRLPASAVKALDALGEGGEEVVSDLLDPVFARLTYNRNAKLSDLETILEDGAVGVLTSALLMGAGGAVNTVTSAASARDTAAPAALSPAAPAGNLPAAARAPQATPLTGTPPVTTTPTETVTNGITPDAITRNAGEIRDIADVFGWAGRRAVVDIYDGKADPVAYLAEFDHLYTAGLSARDVPDAQVSAAARLARDTYTGRSILTTGQLRAAFEAGRADGDNNNMGVIQNGQDGQRGTAVYDIGQGRISDEPDRIATENVSGEQGQNYSAERRAGTGSDKAGGNEYDLRRGGVTRVSARSLGVEGGSERATLEVIPVAEYTEEQARAAADAYAAARVPTRFVRGAIITRGAGGGTVAARGVFSPVSGIVVQADDSSATAGQITRHETYHVLDARAKGDITRRAVERIRATYSKGEFDAVFNVYYENYRAAYAGAGRQNIIKYIYEEIIADAYAGINAFGQNAAKYGGIAREAVSERSADAGTRRGTAAATDRTTGPPGQRFSVNRDFYARFDAWDGKDTHGYFTFGEPSRVLLDVGIPNRAIIMDKSKMVRVIREHGLSRDVLRGLPEMIDKPVLILESRTQRGTYVLYGELYERRGVPVLAALRVNLSTSGPIIEDVNKVTSAYAKDNTQKFIDSSTPLYADTKRIAGWANNAGLNIASVVHRLRLQLPWTSRFGDSDTRSISRSETKSNRNFAENQSQSDSTTESDDFTNITPGQRFSINPDFAREIDEWDGRANTTFTVGSTSDALKSIGVAGRGIIWHGQKIAEILRKHDGMSRDIIKQVPNILEYPVIVIKSRGSESRIVIFGEVYDRRGSPVTAILELMPTSRGGELLDMNVVASAYGKDSNAASFIRNSELLYLTPDKKRAETWLDAVGLQLPSVASSSLGSVGSVSYIDGKVKIDGVPLKRIADRLSSVGLQLPLIESQRNSLRTLDWARSLGLQLPSGVLNQGSDTRNIPDSKAKSNRNFAENQSQSDNTKAPRDSTKADGDITRENIEAHRDEFQRYSIAFHGSPYSFDEFLLDHIGSGEGGAAHGWGLYFAADEKLAVKYRDALSKTSPGVLYTADIPDEDVMLREDGTLWEQPDFIQDLLGDEFDEASDFNNATGRDVYLRLSEDYGKRGASEWLNERGVKGIVYVGRRDGKAYVVFDDKAIKILDKASEVIAGGAETRFSIGETEGGEAVAVIEEDVLDGVPPVLWIKTLKDSIRRKFPDGVKIANSLIKVNSRSLREIFNSEYSKRLKNNRPLVFADKLRAVDSADDVLSAAGNWINEGLNHSRRDSFVSFARGDVLMRIGTNGYSAEIIVGNTASGSNVMYDIVKMKKARFALKKADGAEVIQASEEDPQHTAPPPDERASGSQPATGSAASRARPDDGSILRREWGSNSNPANFESQSDSATESDDITKFSLSEPIEAARDLIAVHNLSVGQLNESIRLGGFAMPSIAVTTSEMGHDRYGDVTVLFGRDTIDPKKSRNNRVYSGDAWTPSFPETGYKLNSAVLRNARSIRNRLLEKYGLAYGDLPEFDASEVESDLRRSNGDLSELYAHSNKMKLMYALDKGLAQPIYKAKDYGVAVPVEFFPALVEAAGEARITEAASGSSDLKRALAPVITEAVNALSRDEYGVELFKKEIPFSQLDHVVDGLAKYIRNGSERELDVYATRDAVDAAMKDDGGYTRWLDGLFDGIVEKRGIRNSKDFFTNSGNRRGFEALYDEITLDNILKAMRKEMPKGGGSWLGTNGVRASASREFKSVDEIRGAAGQLRRLSEAEYSAAKDAVDGRIMGVINEMVGESESFSATDAAAEVLTGAVARSVEPGAIYNYVRREWGESFTPELARELSEAAKEARELPTEYFEAKPRRIVGFDEVRAVIVPDSVSDADMAAIEGAVPYVATYKTGDSAARLEAVNRAADMGDVRFSLSDDPEAAERARAILDMTPVSVTPGEALNKAQAESAARSFGELRNEDDGRVARLPVESVGKIIKHKGYGISRIFSDIPELYETALLAWSEPETERPEHKKHDNIERYRHYINKFEDGAERYFIRFTVAEEKSGRKRPSGSGESLLHSAAVSDVEVYRQTKSGAPQRIRGIDPGEVEGKPLFVDTRLQEFFSLVKREEAPVEARREISTLVDENIGKLARERRDEFSDGEARELIREAAGTLAVHARGTRGSAGETSLDYYGSLFDRDAGERSPDSRGVNGGTRVIASAVRDILTNGVADLRGQKVRSPGDLAALAQIYRNPRFETFRTFYVKGNTIVGHEGVTSRLPSVSRVFLPGGINRNVYMIKDRMRRLGADGYWILHNHPSGSTKPSGPDINVTERFSNIIPGFKGHVIIDTNEYTVIKPFRGKMKGTSYQVDLGAESPRDYSSSPLLGQKILSDKEFYDVASALKDQRTQAALIYVESKGYTTAIQEVPVGLFRNEDGAADYIRGRAREFSASRVFAATVGMQNKKALDALVSAGVLDDAISYTETGVETWDKDFLKTASANVIMGVTAKGFSVREEAENPVSQKIDSAGTSMRQVPALFKDKNAVFGEINIDIGGGAYDDATDFLRGRGVRNMVFDPYNRSSSVNSAALGFLTGGGRADTATVANVLNVIAEPEARANVILQAAKSIKRDGTAYFTVYEGDGSARGRRTSKGWQNNRKTGAYIDEISEYFDDIRRQGKLISAREPVSNLPAALWETEPGAATRFSIGEAEDGTRIKDIARSDRGQLILRTSAATPGVEPSALNGQTGNPSSASLMAKSSVVNNISNSGAKSNRNSVKNQSQSDSATESDDITKFSLSDDERERRGLERENDRLRKLAEHWKAQTRRSKTAATNEADISKYAKELAKNTTLDRGELTASLRGLYNFIAANGSDSEALTWRNVKSRAAEIASDVILNAPELVNPEDARTGKDIRAYLRSAPMYLSETYRAEIADYNDFRKRNFGNFILSNSGRGVDVVYAELAERFGSGYFPDIINPADQIEHIAGLMRDLKPIFETLHGEQAELAAEETANSIIEMFYELRQAPPTSADRAHARYERRVAELSRRAGERVREAVSREVALREKAIAELKAKHAKAQSGLRETYMKRDTRQKIERHAKALAKKLITPTNSLHIPEQFRKSVAGFLSAIDMGAALGAKIGALKDALTGDGGELVIDPDLIGYLEDVQALSGLKLAKMSAEQLDTVWRALRGVEAVVNTADKMFTGARAATVSGIAQKLRSDNAGLARDSIPVNKAIDKVKTLLSLDMLTPETYFHRLGETGDALFRRARDAQDEHIRIMSDVANFTRKLGAKYGIDPARLEADKKTVTLGGEEHTLTVAQIMKLYALSRREQARRHIFTGGVLPSAVDKKIRVKPISGITYEELTDAADALTDAQRDYVKAAQEYQSKTLGEYGNRASMEVYGYKKFNELYYSAIHSNSRELSTSVENATRTASIANRGMTRATVPNASTSIRVDSFFDDFSASASDMATYAAWLPVESDLGRVFNHTFRDETGARSGTVKEILDGVFGLRGAKYLQNLLTDIANGVKGTRDGTDYMDSLTRNYKAAAVGANLRVIVQQPTAIIRAASMINPAYFLPGALARKGWEKAKKYAPIAQWKDWGYFEVGTGRQMKSVLFDSDTKLEKARNALMSGAAAADSVAWGMLWNAVEAETRHRRRDLEPGSKAFYEAVARRFTEIIDHTQVVDGILQRSQLMRSENSVTKMATSFMSEPTKQYNMFLSAVYDARREGDPAARRRALRALGRSLGSLAAGLVVNAAAQSLIDALRDDDKETEYWEKWGAAFFGTPGEEELSARIEAIISGNLFGAFNPANYVPFVKDVMSIIEGFDVTRMDMDSFKDIFTAINQAYNSIFGEGTRTPGAAIARLAAKSGSLFGLPLSNVIRDISGVAGTALAATGSWELAYRAEKLVYDISVSGNGRRFKDIAYFAWLEPDKTQYNAIVADMKANGFTDKDIEDGIKAAVKRAEEYSEEQSAVLAELERAITGVEAYAGLTDEQRETLASNARDYANAVTMEKLNPQAAVKAGSWYAKARDAAKNGVPVEMYIVYRRVYEDLESDRDKDGKLVKGGGVQDKLIAALRGDASLTERQRSYLFRLSSDSQQNNPFGSFRWAA